MYGYVTHTSPFIKYGDRSINPLVRRALTDSRHYVLAQDEAQLQASGSGQIAAPAGVPETGDGDCQARARRLLHSTQGRS